MHDLSLSLLSAHSHLPQTPKSFSWIVRVQCNPPMLREQCFHLLLSGKRRMVSFNSILNFFLVFEFLTLSSIYNRIPLISVQYTSIKNIWELLYCPFQKCCVPRSLHILSSKFESEVFHTGSCFGNICSQIMLFLEKDGDVGFENQGLQREMVDIWGQWPGASLSFTVQ